MIGWVSLGNIIDQPIYSGFNGSQLDIELQPPVILTIELSEDI